MASIKMKNKTISCRFTIPGMELNKQVMANFSPLLRDMVLRGLKARSILRDLMKLMSYYEKAMEKTEAHTMMKSSTFQGFLM